MAYTRPWTKNNPPGGQAANTADDEIRNLREDTEERMAALVTGWNTGAPTDPVVPLAAIKGNVVGKVLYFHHSAFEMDTSWDPGTLNNAFTRSALFAEHVAADANVRLMWMPLILPIGVSIQQVAVIVNRNGAANMTFRFLNNGYNLAPGTTVIGTVNTGANGVLELQLAVPTLTVATTMYYLEVSFPASQAARLYAARVLYDTPDCRITL